MLIGVIGPDFDDIELVSELLTLDRTIQEFDFNKFLGLTKDTIRNCIITDDIYKDYLFKIVEKKFSTVMLTGNIMFSQDLCERFLLQGGTLVIVSRGVTDDQTLRFNRLYEELAKRNLQNLYLVDISQENSEELNRLLEESITWKDTPEDMLLDELGAFESITNLIIGKDNDDMTIENSIEKAMRELGLNLPEQTEVSPITPVVEPKKKKDKKAEPIKKREVTTPQEVQPIKTQQEEQSIFVKFSENTMAILIPENIHITKQVIGDTTFNVTTVEIPDINNKSLQELSCSVTPVVSHTTPQPKKKAAEPEKIKKREKTPEITTYDLASLKQVKAELDQKIKEARQQGNTEEVNALRKQRRAVRAKINKLKH